MVVIVKITLRLSDSSIYSYVSLENRTDFLSPENFYKHCLKETRRTCFDYSQKEENIVVYDWVPRPLAFKFTCLTPFRKFIFVVDFLVDA